VAIRRIAAFGSLLRTNLAGKAGPQAFAHVYTLGTNNEIGGFIKARRSSTWAFQLHVGQLPPSVHDGRGESISRRSANSEQSNGRVWWRLIPSVAAQGGDRLQGPKD
jgi:hypothetical protein